MNKLSQLSLPTEFQRSDLKRTIRVVGSIAAVALLWALHNRYLSLGRDGELYAVQAFARLQPQLMSDVFLANASQENFTIFSLLYAFFIRLFGLINGGKALFVLGTVGFYSAAFGLARALHDKFAGLTLVMLISVVGFYGAFNIFSYSENYLTARTLAEALVVTSLFAYHRGRSGWAFLLITAGFLAHPLMTLPGAILLVCLHLPMRLAALVLGVGILSVAALADLVSQNSIFARFLTVMDADWLYVVRERSQFLFLQYWDRGDWAMHARAFLCLAVTAAVVQDRSIRRLSIAAALVGAAGLMVTLIAGSIGPVAIFVQGQAWRWFWITNFTSLLLLIPTIACLWNTSRAGQFCGALLLTAWLFPLIDGYLLAAIALGLWLVRSRLSTQMDRVFKLGTFGLGIIVLIWVSATQYSRLSSPHVDGNLVAVLSDRARLVLGLPAAAVIVFGACWHWLRTDQLLWRLIAGTAALAALGAMMLATSFNQARSTGTAQEYAEFADWRREIPPLSNVLVASDRISAAFTWFTLQRPNYLSVDQSSGVVFSPITAAEIRRRAEVLRPLMEPSWQILTRRQRRRADQESVNEEPRKLDAQSLVSICSDSQLAFVISQEDLHFSRVQHTHSGPYRGWNLYDCRRVLNSGPSE